MDELLACAEVTVNMGDLWTVLNHADAEVTWPDKVWKARMSLYKAINSVRVEQH